MYDGASVGGVNTGVDTFLPITTKAQKTPPLKTRWLEFLIESSEEERRILNFGISSAITSLIAANRPVYLEGFGIVFPVEQIETSTTYSDRTYELQEETLQRIKFEKCNDLNSYQHDTYKNIVDTKELIPLIKEKIDFFVKWKDTKINNYVRGLFTLLRHEVIAYGFSERLSQLGLFYALHNRQGEEESTWFSGADIFIVSNLKNSKGIKRHGNFVRPILSSATETFEAYYGQRKCYLAIDILSELKELGVDYTDFVSCLRPPNDKLHIAVYHEVQSSNGNGAGNTTNGAVIFVSDGVRQHGINAAKVGCELVLRFLPNRLNDLTEEDYKNICARPLAMAWMLTVANRKKIAECGEGLDAEVPLVKDGRTPHFTSILITDFKLINGEQLTNDGPFVYRNVTMLYQEEAAIVAKFGSSKTLPLFSHRGIDRTCKEGRFSLFGKKGVFESNPMVV